MNQENTPSYISSVHLKGYKSIKDLEITLNAGLNIIIGTNGSGKSNFLAFLDAANWGYYDKLLSETFELEIKGNKYTLVAKGYNEISDDLKFVVKEFIYNNNEIIEEIENIYDNSLEDKIQKRKYNKEIEKTYPTIFIGFDNILNTILNNRIALHIKKNNNAYRFWLSPNIPYYSFLNDIFSHTKDIIIDNENDLLIGIEKEITHKLSEFNQYLSRFSVIKDIKIYSKYHSIKNDKSNPLISEGIELLFLIHNKYLNWHQLSDGTKRLFYIIGSIVFSKNKIILLDEPELGIHPEQLYKLMDFIKEQSQEKQIIITTHSPEVLNILEANELDSIIVTHYDDDKGTQMHKLSAHQIRKGQIYMEETGALSSFWIHSNLEEYEAENA